MPPVSSSSQPKLSELATACSDAAVTTPRVSASAAYAKSRSSSLGAVALGFSAYAAGHWSVRTPALTARSRARALLPCLRGLAAAFPVSMHTAAQPNDRPSATARRGRHVALVQGREALGRAGVSASQGARDRPDGWVCGAGCLCKRCGSCVPKPCVCGHCSVVRGERDMRLAIQQSALTLHAPSLGPLRVRQRRELWGCAVHAVQRFSHGVTQLVKALRVQLERGHRAVRQRGTQQHAGPQHARHAAGGQHNVHAPAGRRQGVSAARRSGAVRRRTAGCAGAETLQAPACSGSAHVPA